MTMKTKTDKQQTIFDWLDSRGTRYRWAAENLFQVHYGSLWRVNKKGVCCKELANKIYLVTDGAVDYRKTRLHY